MNRLVTPRSFSEVYDVIRQRQKNVAETESYVSSLMNKGTDAILKKIGEESAEVIIAAKNLQKEACIHELTDLWFDLMVLMVHQEIDLNAIHLEFGRRFGQSGLEEKASRSQASSSP